MSAMEQHQTSAGEPKAKKPCPSDEYKVCKEGVFLGLRGGR